MEKVAELICSTVEDRSIMTGILVKNGYTVGPGRIPRKSGKSYDYTLKIYREKEEEIQRWILTGGCAIQQSDGR